MLFDDTIVTFERHLSIPKSCCKYHTKMMLSFRIFTYLALFILCTEGLAGSDTNSGPEVSERPLRVLSWNIEWFPGKGFESTPDREQEQIEAAQAELRRLDPDILIASEIRDWAAFEEAVRVVPGLRIHVVSHFRATESGELWRQQVAIASRLKCRAAWSEMFEPTIPLLTRGFGFAALEDPESGGLIMVYAVHLKSNRSSTEEEARMNFTIRDESTKQILNHMEEMKQVTFQGDTIRGWIFAGDFNTNHDGQFGDRVIAKIEEAGFWNSWKKTPREKRLTWRGNDLFEATTFDYIFLKGFGSPEAFMAETAEETSDHDGVMLELDLSAR